MILPYELLLDAWKQKYDKSKKSRQWHWSAVSTDIHLKATYGNSIWEKQLKSPGGEPIPSYASNFVFRRGDKGQHTLLLNVYVDDCTLAGGTVEIQQFWEELRQKVKLEPEEFVWDRAQRS